MCTAAGSTGGWVEPMQGIRARSLRAGRPIIVQRANLMQKIKVSEIQQGRRFDQALFNPQGKMLLAAGVDVTPAQLKILRAQPLPELLLAESMDELIAEGVVAAPANYKPPRPSAESERLSEDETQTINRRRDLIKIAEPAALELEEGAAGITTSVTPQAQTIWADQPESAEDWSDTAGLEKKRDKITKQIAGWLDALDAGEVVAIDDINETVGELYDDLLNHRRRFAQLALLVKRRENYLPGHAFCVSVLAMATAAQLKWGEADIRALGAVAMVYDAGMVLVPDRVRSGSVELSELDRNRIHRHPAYSVAMLRKVKGMSQVQRLAALQHHERENAMGYPRGMRGDRMCDYARVLGVADVYAAASSPRSYSKAKLPYTTMEEIIRSAAAGTFCRATVRAMVAAAGLFPVGSYVTLSNHQLGHVLACNPQRLDRPLVRLVDEAGEPTADAPIDLSDAAHEKLAVVKPAARPEAA